MNTISPESIRSYKHSMTKPLFVMRDTCEEGQHERWGNVATPTGIVEVMAYHSDKQAGWDSTSFEMVVGGRRYTASIAEWLTARQITARAKAFARLCMADAEEGGRAK